MREQGIKRRSNKKLYRQIRVEFDRAIDRSVMTLRRLREGKLEPAEDHLVRSLEYLVDLKALSNELIKRYQNTMKDARRKKKELAKMRGYGSEVRAAYMPEIFELTWTPLGGDLALQPTGDMVGQQMTCTECGDTFTTHEFSEYHRGVCNRCHYQNSNQTMRKQE